MDAWLLSDINFKLLVVGLRFLECPFSEHERKSECATYFNVSVALADFPLSSFAKHCVYGVRCSVRG